VSNILPISRTTAADWLVRSALPPFLSLISREEDAARLAGLPPFEGHTPHGRIRGWRGTAALLRDVRTEVDDVYIWLAQTYGRRWSYDPGRHPGHDEVRRIANFGRHALLPSRIGWDAYYLLNASSRVLARAAEAADELDDALDALDDAWDAAWRTASDRAHVDAIADLSNGVSP